MEDAESHSTAEVVPQKIISKVGDCSVVIFPPSAGRFYRFSRVSNSTIYEGKQMMHLEFFTKLQNCIKIFFKILPLRFLQNDDEIARVPLGLQTSDTSSCLLNCPRAE